jgi:leucyl aminopeptidase
MTLPCFTTELASQSTAIKLVKQSDYTQWLSKQSNVIQEWLTSSQFRTEPGSVSLIPGASGKLEFIICCIADKNSFWSVGNLPLTLPDGNYHFEATESSELFAMAWGLGAYQFTRYKKPSRTASKLFISKDQAEKITRQVQAIYLVRDLINTPTDDMGPTELSQCAADFSKAFDVSFKQIVGDELVKQNYPLIYAVGRASDDAPRLIDLRWGSEQHPKITLVGKGVCFDTGGLDIKPSSAMLLMKKDMGGAAHVLGLAQMIVSAKLPVRLRVLIPLVENAVSGNAYRPGDILQSRKGITVEIGNTDAEGRLVLADALTEAVSEQPDLLIDIATLTGAARVALGTDLPALFSNDDEVAHAVIQHATKENDPVWRMPLFSGYRESLNTPFADINNCSSDAYGGAITAALFLKEFVPDNIPWMHLDLMAWNLKSRPGRPQGGEAMAIRGLFSFLQNKYS